MERRFWKIKYESGTTGHDSEPHEVSDLYWGTWMEAARHCIKYDCGHSIKIYREHHRSIREFSLPDTKGKRKGFFVC